MEGLQGGTRATARRALKFVVLTVCAALGLALAARPRWRRSRQRRPRRRRSRDPRAGHARSWVTSRSATRSRSDTRSQQVVPAPNYPDAFELCRLSPSLLGLRVAPDRRERGVSGRDVHEPDRGTILEHHRGLLCERAPRECGYRPKYPLHVKYSGSQLDYAVSYLKKHTNVRLVSLMIGANDFFACEAATADHCASLTEVAGGRRDDRQERQDDPVGDPEQGPLRRADRDRQLLLAELQRPPRQLAVDAAQHHPRTRRPSRSTS